MRNTLIQIVVCCVIGSSLASCSHRTENNSLKTGRDLEEHGDYIGAMEYYENMSDEEFRDICTHNLRHLYGDILDAMLAQKSSPNSPEAYYALGKAFYEKALSIPGYEEIEPNQRFDTSTYFAERQQQFYAQSQNVLESATQLKPNYADALLIQGKIYEDLDEPERAVPVYQQLVDLEPTSPEVLLRAGKVLFEQGQPEEGFNLIKQAITLEPENPEAHFVLGQLYARQGDGAQSLVEFQQVLCQNPNYIEAYHKLANLYLTQNNLVEAERLLRSGVLKNPNDYRLVSFYGSLKAVADDQEVREMTLILQDLVGQISESLLKEALKGKDFEASPGLQIQYYRLYLKALLRRQPYVLSCSGKVEHPFFVRQRAVVEEKIGKLQHDTLSAEASVPSPK